jgi:hypothetical protein
MIPIHLSGPNFGYEVGKAFIKTTSTSGLVWFGAQIADWLRAAHQVKKRRSAEVGVSSISQ